MSTVLLVIDMQNDYLYEKRKKNFSYNTQQLVSAVNEITKQYNNSNHDVIYIRHIIQNLPTNRLLFGYSIAGTEGAELYSGLNIVSKYCFDKLLGDALSNKKLRELLAQKGGDTLHLCGLDECGCVTATALGAVKRGYNAVIIRKGTATAFSAAKVAKTHNRLKNAGVRFI